MDEALQRAIERLVELGFELERLTPDGYAELRRGDQSLCLWLSDGEVLVTGDLPDAPPVTEPEPPTASAAVLPEDPAVPSEPERREDAAAGDWGAGGDDAFPVDEELERVAAAEDGGAELADSSAPLAPHDLDESLDAIAGVEAHTVPRPRSRRRRRRLLLRLLALLVLLALAALVMVIMGEDASSPVPSGATGAALVAGHPLRLVLHGTRHRAGTARMPVSTRIAARGSATIGSLRGHVAKR